MKKDKIAPNEDTAAGHLAGTESEVRLEMHASARASLTPTFLEHRHPTSPRAPLENESGSETSITATETEIAIIGIETIGIETTETKTETIATPGITEITETETAIVTATGIENVDANAAANAAANAVEIADAHLHLADGPLHLFALATTNHQSRKRLHSTSINKFNQSSAASRPKGSIAIPPETDPRNGRSVKVDHARRDVVLRTPAPQVTDIAPDARDPVLLDVVLLLSPAGRGEIHQVEKMKEMPLVLESRNVDTALALLMRKTLVLHAGRATDRHYVRIDTTKGIRVPTNVIYHHEEATLLQLSRRVDRTNARDGESLHAARINHHSQETAIHQLLSIHRLTPRTTSWHRSHPKRAQKKMHLAKTHIVIWITNLTHPLNQLHPNTIPRQKLATTLHPLNPFDHCHLTPSGET
ncbi:hypothetical protein TWF696_007196 [Orbilia brochopaga]|uniref:Uncharacterized protein n=1 Tax=Orbilia brochopaga TaxID=3140254 RepID=A0AAV9UUS5_9PEZI